MPDTTDAIPALSSAPGAVDVLDTRARLTAALASNGDDLAEDARTALTDALTAPSPVDALVRAFDILAANQASLGAVMLARAIECADAIAVGQFHNRGDEAAAFVAAARDSLAAFTE